MRHSGITSWPRQNRHSRRTPRRLLSDRWADESLLKCSRVSCSAINIRSSTVRTGSRSKTSPARWVSAFPSSLGVRQILAGSPGQFCLLLIQSTYNLQTRFRRVRLVVYRIDDLEFVTMLLVFGQTMQMTEMENQVKLDIASISS